MAIPSGEIYLLNNVPLLPDYEHIIDFASKDEQFSFFRGYIKHNLASEAYSYIRREREFITVELPLHALDDINYLMFRSAEGERLYYAFVTDKSYINDVSSNVYFTIDVMQTYAFDYTWKASYIKQAHVDRWTAELKPIYSKTDEGLDYGDEYSVENAYRIEQSDSLRWLLVSMKNYSKLEGVTNVVTGGNIEPAPSPFSCFLVPLPIKPYTDPENLTNTTMPLVRYLSSGSEAGDSVLISDYGDLVKLMDNTAIGDYIQSISVLSYNPFIVTESVVSGFIYIGIRDTASVTTVAFQDSTGTAYSFLVLTGVGYNTLKGGNTLAKTKWDIGLSSSMPTAEQWAEIKANPYNTKRDKRFESKLLCAPYRYNILTDWRSNPVIYKNEYMTTDKLEIKFSYGLSYNAPFRYWIKDYKRDPEGRNNNLAVPLAMDFPIISDAYYSYMLQNKNTIQANLTNSIISAGTGIISGAISGGGVGGIGGAIFGGVTAGVGGALNVQAQIRSENAKQKDLKAKPDTVINSNDSSFNILDNNAAITFYRMAICCENEEIIAELFNMTGYKVNRLEIPNTRSRVRFNYLQTMGANIVGSISQDELMKIKDVFNKGVTIWHYNKDNFNMLDYSFENVERILL